VLTTEDTTDLNWCCSASMHWEVLLASEEGGDARAGESHSLMTTSFTIDVIARDATRMCQLIPRI